LKFSPKTRIFNIRPVFPPHRTQEKAVILLSSPYIPASAPDTALFVDALNAGTIELFAPRLAADAAMLTEDGRRAIRGTGRILSHFTARLDDLRQGDAGDYLVVPGLLLDEALLDDDASHPCAIFYDGFHKSCVFQLGHSGRDFVDRIVLSARESTLRHAWPLEPPAFRDTAIRPSLAEIRTER
jgi:hypothetical protein